jgi:retron-type reverse transcriptase
MKRHGQLFDQAFTRASLYRAYLEARRKKRSKRATFDFEINLGGNLAALHDEIHSGCYRPLPYRTFMVYEPKPRLIYAPEFRDRVVQHAIYRLIAPIFDRTFIATSFACRPGYGTHKASEHTQQMLRACDPESYTLKLDVRKFFYRIDRNILRLLVEQKIKDHRMVEIAMFFSESVGPVGIPIGNLLSQIFALIYLNPLDHYIKRNLKIEHYARYVDDMLIVGVTRPEALQLRLRIEEFLADNLHLEYSKTTIQRVKRGVNFVGFRTWRNRRLIRKHSLYKFRRAVKKADHLAVTSILGHAQNTTSLPHLVRILRETTYGQNLQLSKKVRRLHDLPGAGNRGKHNYRTVYA